MFFRKFADQSGELNKKHINTKIINWKQLDQTSTTDNE